MNEHNPYAPPEVSDVLAKPMHPSTGQLELATRTLHLHCESAIRALGLLLLIPGALIILCVLIGIIAVIGSGSSFGITIIFFFLFSIVGAKNEARRGLSPDLTGALRLMPSAFALARPLAFKPPVGDLPSLRCQAGVFISTPSLCG